MKLSSETWIVIAAVLLAALLAAQEPRNQWTMTRGNAPDMVHFRIEHSSKGSQWSQSNDVPLANFHGLNTSQSGPAKFEYIEDAGSLLCQGRFSFGAGSGNYTFQPNPKFTSGLVNLGYDPPTEAQSFSMMLMRVTLDFARGVRDAGLKATTAQLVDLRVHGITLPYIRETQNSGYTTFEARDFIEMKIHGVSTDFLRALKHAGYELPASRITDLKIHGVSSEYMRDLNIYGLRPEAQDIVQMKIHGVSPEFLKGLKDAGYGDLSANQVTELKNHGLDPKFIQAARELGYEFTPRELIDLKTHGVSAEYLRHIQESGMRNLTAQQITKLKIHGVE
uniref:4-hydroxy-3-methylbut-2-enyl diphosphate reductase n=1 Tax=Solibacter usitatus (strain Ellin6076) TaxID=234267 RepID=Q01SU5_SOLUE